MTTTPRRPTAGSIVTAILTALVTLLCIGCGSSGQPTQEETMDAQAVLAARPSLEQTIATYDQMLQRIRIRLDTELGPFTWYEADPLSRRPCGPTFPSHLGGRTINSPLWGFEGNIPDDQWSRAKRIVADITAEYGFATMGLQIDTPSTADKPGHHLTHGFDITLDARYRFGTNVNTNIQVTSGCHRSTNPIS